MKRNAETHLLPPNALSSERSLSLAILYGDDILPEDIKNLWNLETVPRRFLSYLAWGLHVDFWRDDMDEAYKRKLIASSFSWHRKKGTPWAVKKVLADLGVEARVLEWFEIGTEPHTFAVEAEFDYVNSEPFSITAETKALLLEAVEWTKPERSHLAYLSFVPKDDDHDPSHRCIYDVCNFSHGYLWTRDLEISLLGEVSSLFGHSNGYYKRAICSTSAYQWSALYDAHRFSDLPFGAIEHIAHRKIYHIVKFEDRSCPHRWHKTRSWLCGGTWERACALEKITSTISTFSRSTGVFGDSISGEINTVYSGGYELIVPHIGTFGMDEFSGRAIDGASFQPILEFTF